MASLSPREAPASPGPAGSAESAGSPGRLPAPGSAAAWLIAARPKTLPAAVAPVLVGSALAASHGSFRAPPALAALAGALLIQVGTNLANDYYDFVKGADTADRLGPARAAQAGLIAPEAVKRGAIAALGAAVVVGLYLAWVGGWPIVVIGVASIVAALAYTAGPMPIAYAGLGELFVFVFFGLVAVGGTYWVQALSLGPGVLLAGVAMGALSSAILVANNLRDIGTDAAAGKRTLAVRIGPRATKVQYALLLALAGAVPPLGIALADWSPWTMLALAAAPLGVDPLRRIFRFRDPRELVPALGGTARVLMAYAALLAAGLLL